MKPRSDPGGAATVADDGARGKHPKRPEICPHCGAASVRSTDRMRELIALHQGNMRLIAAELGVTRQAAAQYAQARGLTDLVRAARLGRRPWRAAAGSPA